MQATTATWAAIRSATSRGRARCSCPISCASALPISSRWPIWPRPRDPAGSYGKGATVSPGKDTTTGHWEMAGIWLDQAFPVYPHGFPKELIAEFERQIGRRTLGNKPASGTEIIKELGEEHVRTGFPIVYTSGDSVFQIAAHEDVIPIAELYRMCEIARKLLDGPNRVGRVIARPFAGTAGNFRRTERRHDYAVEPPRPMLLDVLAERNVPVFGVGKIHDIYNGRGVDDYVTTKNNADGMAKLTESLARQPNGLIFANLVDFDMLYGHRKDVEGFARSLEEFDALLGPVSRCSCAASDLLIITADHGCDPDPVNPTTDHSREYVPIIAYSPRVSAGVNLGIRADAGGHGADRRGKFRREHSPRHKFPSVSAGLVAAANDASPDAGANHVAVCAKRDSSFRAAR